MKKLLLGTVLLFVTLVGAQKEAGKKYRIKTIAFYNLENLFDTINDLAKNDEASPIMELKTGRSEVYRDKLKKLATVLAQIGKKDSNSSPSIIGIAEVENRKVIEDLVQTEPLRTINYNIIHYDSPDNRGIDVALIYKASDFTPIHHQVFDPNIYDRGKKIYTRDQLLVSGYLDDELIHIIVNHWPSRRGGEARSRPLREKAAYQNTKIIEKIKQTDKKPKVLIIGDFNDDPINSSFKNVLKTKARRAEVKEGEIYNPFERMFKKGFNTLGYRDNISMFDQILLSSPLVDEGKKDFSSYKLFRAGVFNKSFLTVSKGRYKGYPFRSFLYGSYTGGYSDHYPVYVHLIKEE